MGHPNIITGTNLTEAWCSTLGSITNNAGTELSPLVLTLTGFEENLNSRQLLNEHLLKSKLDSIDTVSETIFPDSLYQFYDRDRNMLFKKYLETVTRIKKIDTRNIKGTYFERMIAYGEEKKVNQLDIIIKSLKSKTVKRRSKLQVSIFDPLTDHTNGAFQGFPCLQHVTFYKSENGGLVINSFYAIQYLYQRAYGNWLGLINLGRFIANESNLELERFNCFIGVEKLDHLTKNQAKKLLSNMV